ncbi:MBL fold metallo-hydrolase [Candidatus Nitrospira bockiana]
MAHPAKRLPANVEGPFFVDSTCINCDTCRQLAPDVFREEDDYSVVWRQPPDGDSTLRAYQALIACPVGSIGTHRAEQPALRTARASFPLPIAPGLYYNGFNSEKSFGANSYLLQRPDGNWLIDAPRYTGHLVEAFTRLGGVRSIFLTHADDVADAARYAERFGAVRVMHEADAWAMPGVERLIRGAAPSPLADGLLAVPVPGHTAGSTALFADHRYLFTGDHLWWEPDRGELAMPSVYVWSESRLYASTERLRDLRFEWVLPGHGHRISLPAEAMQAALTRLLAVRALRTRHVRA